MPNNPTPGHSLGEKAMLVLVAAAGALFLGAVLAPDILPQPARQVQGFVVGKKWSPRWIRKRRYIVPARFFVVVANADSYRTLQVDSLRWASFRLGQPACYRYQPLAFWE